ncbi:ribosome small subunit-dependent GTPase A [Rhodococcus chondri]|uniref:Small ribosomal subunit biogenesis GTPase RsgA n=1 Tax=Rhodococcus chondri TaxID=3065941 RepID=A0ABU7JUC5_9NOCA|nr:ribosome small subunit-dependent GTPase A [Rhodococcus sp. CC-R104]MEE2033352.1 ribosome small subunit-dependent GTPase A [Rhodococcus sp. CC-R104]
MYPEVLPGIEPLAEYGWSPQVAERFADSDVQGTPGRIVRAGRGSSEAVTSAGPLTVRAAGHHLCTGDWVIVREPATDGDTIGTVCAVLPRTGAIRRADASGRSEEQVLAANVDTVVVTVAADTVDLGRVERLLVLAWDSGAQPVVALTKVDLTTEPVFERVVALAPGASVVEVCALDGSGLSELRDRIHGTVVFVGVSGAGKSTLVNALCGRDIQATAPVRQGDGKGRHTTTDREMFPLGDGMTLIDTPGLRGVGMWDAGAGIAAAFPDIDDLAQHCRFTDCAHESEPGCAVRSAVEHGDLDARRVESHRKLQRENQWVTARADARLRHERTREAKVLSRAIRAYYRDR